MHLVLPDVQSGDSYGCPIFPEQHWASRPVRAKAHGAGGTREFNQTHVMERYLGMVSLRAWMLKTGVILVVSLALLLGVFSALSVQRAAKARAQVRAALVLDTFQSDMEGAFRRAEGLAHALADRWRQGRADLDSPVMLKELMPFLDREGPVSSLMLYDARRQVLFLNLMPNGWEMQTHRWGSTGMTSFNESDGSFKQVTTSDYMQNYRVEGRPWFQFIQANPRPGWMPEAYRFPPGMAGLTYLEPILDEKGALRAVVGADINLASLTQAIWTRDANLRSIEVCDHQGRLLMPAWTPALQANPKAVVGLQLRQRPPRAHVLAERRLQAATGLALAARVLEQPGDLAWGWLGWGQVLLFPGLAVVLLTAFTVALRGHVLAPLERLATSRSSATGQSPGARVRIREINHLDESLRKAQTAEVQLNQLQQHLEHLQRTETIEAMAPGIVHDAKNELAVAMGNLSICTDVLTCHPELEPFLERAKGATMRCSEVLKALLAYSRYEAGAAGPLDLVRSVQDALPILGSTLNQDITLEVEAQEPSCWIHGEQVKVQQVLLNLALNARDAMPEGGRLRLRTSSSGDAAFLEVEDTGIGIPDAVKARVFEPFFTTKPAGQGTGLGLAMVASIVEGMGGQVEVHSQAGEGTRFRLQFPVLSIGADRG